MSRLIVSDVTAALMELLAAWPRRLLQAALDASRNPVEELVSGEIRRVLHALGKSESPRGEKQSRTHTYDIYAHGPHDRVVGFYDDAFPPRLREIADPPLLLFYQGDLAVLQEPTVAVVGARRASDPGKAIAQTLGQDLALAGCCVVSGLAAGIDAAAHRGALESCGRTAAFLGHGLATVYPAWHRALAQNVVGQGGLLVSEYPYQAPPRAFRFPERNRLISGASMMVVVVEASLQSGSLITARMAAEQGRDVVAVPGPVRNALSAGCHKLIRSGAGLVTSAVEVLEELGMEAPPAQAAPVLEGNDARVYGCLNDTPRLAEEVAAAVRLPFPEVVSALVTLELRGIVRQQGLGYIRTSSPELEQP